MDTRHLYWILTGPSFAVLRLSREQSEYGNAYEEIQIADTLIKKKTKFSSNIRKSGRERLQSHICLTASSCMTKYLSISPYIKKPFPSYMTLQQLPSEFPKKWGKFYFLFYQCIVENREVLESTLTASSYMTKYLRISPYIRKPFPSYMTLRPLPS